MLPPVIECGDKIKRHNYPLLDQMPIDLGEAIW